MMNAEEMGNIRDSLSYFIASDGLLEFRIFHSFSGNHRNTFSLKINRTNVLNAFYKHLHATAVILHNDGFLSDCLFCKFLYAKPWLTFTWHLCILLYLQQISAHLIQINLRKLTFSPPWLTLVTQRTIHLSRYTTSSH